MSPIAPLSGRLLRDLRNPHEFRDVVCQTAQQPLPVHLRFVAQRKSVEPFVGPPRAEHRLYGAESTAIQASALDGVDLLLPHMGVLHRLGLTTEEHGLSVLRLRRIAQALLTTRTATAQLLAALEANPLRSPAVPSDSGRPVDGPPGSGTYPASAVMRFAVSVSFIASKCRLRPSTTGAKVDCS